MQSAAGEIPLKAYGYDSVSQDRTIRYVPESICCPRRRYQSDRSVHRTEDRRMLRQKQKMNGLDTLPQHVAPKAKRW